MSANTQDFDAKCSSCETKVDFLIEPTYIENNQLRIFSLRANCPTCQSKVYADFNFDKYLKELLSSNLKE